MADLTMRRSSAGVVCAILIAVVIARSSGARADQTTPTRPTNPNALSVEVLGKGFLYTVQYDRAISDDAFAGIGFGSVSMNFPNGADAGVSANLVPIYAGWYFVRDAGSPFVIIGADVVTNHGTVVNTTTSLAGVQIPSNQVLPFFGAGYEVRTDSGFLFRVTGYGIVGTSAKPWFGATFGYAF